MKAAAFSYAKPSSVDEVIKLKARHGDGARFLAGGQSLMPALNLRLDKPDLLIDINGLADLSGIVLDGSTLKIGALARHSALGRSEIVAKAAPLLTRCVEHIAHPAIRNSGTIGGSLALADPAAEWPAACLALDARLIAIGPDGERAIAAGEFFQGLYATALLTDEMLARIEIPAAPAGVRVTALELTRRRGDFAIVGLLVQAMAGAGGALSEVRTAYFGVSDRPMRLPAFEQALTGTPNLDAARAALDAGLRPQADLYHTAATKLHLAKVLAGRAVAELAGGGA